MKVKRYNQSGLTLVETLTAISLLGVLVIGLMGFAKMSFRAYGDTSNTLKETRNIRVAVDRIVTELRSAKKAEISASGKEITYQRYNDDIDRKIYFGDDKRLYMDGKPVTKRPVWDVEITYNSHDPQKTIDIVVKMNDSMSIMGSVRPFNNLN